ncbi:MAG: Stp1/IreP family PP2C-type Ser/Thr phosphatase [Anaerolineae bacterium]|nr:Stp1/IreP family PP2C-type Ser/Thr phosphatase [Anaerolineae bacterium]
MKCPQCQFENPEDAIQCQQCQAPLAQPAKGAPTIQLGDAGETGTTPKNSAASPKKTIALDGGKSTRQLEPPADLTPRPDGAIIAGRFKSDALIHQTNTLVCYKVSEISQSPEMQTRVCDAPNCGAVHFFTEPQDEVDEFCAGCGQSLQAGSIELELCEAHAPFYGILADVATAAPVHGGLRPPLIVFEETLGPETRYGLVKPHTKPLPEKLEREQVLTWGSVLADALDILYHSQFTFNGNISENVFAMCGDHMVFADFSGVLKISKTDEAMRKADVHALATLLYKWLTGKTEWSAEAALPEALNLFFEKALTGAGYGKGAELSAALAKAAAAAITSVSVDLRTGRLTDVGRVRSLNEDSLLTVELCRVETSTILPLGLYVVADGMGGHSAGEVASGAIVSYLSQHAPSEMGQNHGKSGNDWAPWLRAMVQGANNAVYELRKGAGTDMGSTCVAALVEGTRVYIANVGDSRAYKIDADGIRQLSVDHSLVQRLIATGQITPAEARNHPQRNVIYRTMGDKQNVEVDTFSFAFSPGEKLLLCSDGLDGMVEDADILRIVREHADNQAACQALIETANAAGGDDNITIIIVEIV